MTKKALVPYDFPSVPLVNGATTWFVTPTGTNATGTWGISISGNAATATNVAWSGVTGKPTTVAGYGITDAVKYGDIIQNDNPFGGNRLYFNTLGNLLYLANSRYTVTASGISPIANVFDGDYESNALVAAGATGVFTINFGGDYNGYPYGDLLLSCYYSDIPQSVSIRVYCNYAPQGIGWKTLTVTTLKNGPTATIFKANNQFYAIQQIEVTVVSPAGTPSRITQFELAGERPGNQLTPVYNKYRNEIAYKDINWLAGSPRVSGNLVLHAGNYTDYTVTKTGTGASGTWGISISGNAAGVVNGSYYLNPAATGTSMAVAGNVGIGTTSPGAKLTVVAPEAIRMANASPYLSFYNSAQSVRFGYAQHTGTNLALVNEQAGSLDMYTSNTLRATLDASGNLLVGTASASLGASGRGLIETNGTSSAINALKVNGVSTAYLGAFASVVELAVQANVPLAFLTNNTERARIDTSGNLGLGVTPSAWGNIAGTKALQVGNYGSYFFGCGNGWSANPFTYVGNNAFHDGVNWRYVSSAPTAQYVQSADQHIWNKAAGGIVGNNITFTESMKLDANGVLTVNNKVQSFDGFQNTAYVSGARNRIWSFGNADGFGLSYFHGATGISSQDTIGIHMGTATAASSGWTFNRADLSFRSAGPILQGGNQVLHAGNYTSYVSPRIADNTNGLRIANPGGGSFVSTAPITGAIKIRLPAAAKNTSTMVRFTVKIYNYATGTSRTIDVGGYSYSGGSWINCFAEQQTSDGDDIYVRFGEDATSECVWIGQVGTVWDYPQVFVTDVQAGYSNYTDALWGSGWNISIVTAFDTVDHTFIARRPLHTGNYNSYAPTLTGTGAYGTWGINVTGSASSANSITAGDNRTISPSEGATGGAQFGFTSWANNNASPYADFLHLRSYGDASGGNDNLVMFRKDAIGMRIWQQAYGSATAYSSYKDVAFTDGTGASGTWGISVTGNANTVDGYHIQVDGTGTDPNTIYLKTTGGSITVAWADITGKPTTRDGYGITDVPKTDGTSATGTWGIGITGNAATATNVAWTGVTSKPTTRDGYGITDVPKTDGTSASGTWGINVTGNAATVTNGVYTTGNQTIAGNKTFSGTTALTEASTVDGVKIGFRNVPVNLSNAALTLSAAYDGECIYKNNTTAYTYTIPDGLPDGTVFTIANCGSAGNITLSMSGTEVLRLAGTTSTGARTIAPYGEATVHRVGGMWLCGGAGVT